MGFRQKLSTFVLITMSTTTTKDTIKSRLNTDKILIYKASGVIHTHKDRLIYTYKNTYKILTNNTIQ